MNPVNELAIQWLTTRHYSEFELRNRLHNELAETDHDESSIEAAITHCMRLNLINDARLAESTAWRHAHQGNRHITQVLQKKGISKQIITNTLSHVDAAYYRVLAEARHEGTGVPPEQRQSLVSHFLNGCTIPPEAIEAVLWQLNEEHFFEPAICATQRRSNTNTTKRRVPYE